MHETAIEYLRGGVNCLPAIIGEKRPAVKWTGYQKEFLDEKNVPKLFKQFRGICIVAGAISGSLEMIDFDCAGKFFEPWIAKVDEIAPGLLDRLVVERSPSGGYHVGFRSDAADGNLKLAAEVHVVDGPGKHEFYGKSVEAVKAGGQWACSMTSIETRGNGGIFLCSPTPGYDMVQGDWSAVPTITAEERQILFDAARSFNQTTPAPVPPTHPAAKAYEGESVFEAYKASGAVRDLLEKSGWKYLSSNGANELWQRPGKTGKGHSAHLDAEHGFFVFSSNAYPLEPNRCYSPGQLFAILVHDGDLKAAARDLLNRGYGSRMPRIPDNSHRTAEHFCTVDDTESEPTEAPEPMPGVIDDPGPFPERLLGVPGFVGDVARYIADSAFVRQPTIALGAAISLQATLIGKFWKTARNTRSNTYILVLAKSSSGKDRGKEVIKQVLAQIDLGNRERGRYASYQALQNDVARGPVIWLWDELGKYLPSMTDKRNHWLSGIFGTLMDLHSSAKSTFVCDMRASDDAPTVIDQPHLVIFGSSTFDQTLKAFTTEMIDDGFLSRCHLFEANLAVEGPDKFVESVPPVPASIIEQAKFWADKYFSPQPNDKTLLAFPAPEVVPQTPEAVLMFEELLKLQKQMTKAVPEPYNALWGKVVELADQLALVYALSENRENPVIGADAAGWACKMVEYLTRRKVFIASRHIADGPFERLQMDILNFIEKKGEATLNQITRQFWRIEIKRRKDAIDNLIETGKMVERDKKTKTKTSKVFGLPFKKNNDECRIPQQNSEKLNELFGE